MSARERRKEKLRMKEAKTKWRAHEKRIRVETNSRAAGRFILTMAKIPVVRVQKVPLPCCARAR
jgi:hypothetical protein